MGSKNLCKTHEAERTHGQREGTAAEQRRHTGRSCLQAQPVASPKCSLFRMLNCGAGIRALVALGENLSFIPSTQVQ